MDLQSKACHRALSSRDPRLDERFYTGVSSTGKLTGYGGGLDIKQQLLEWARLV